MYTEEQAPPEVPHVQGGQQLFELPKTNQNHSQETTSTDDDQIILHLIPHLASYFGVLNDTESAYKNFYKAAIDRVVFYLQQDPLLRFSLPDVGFLEKWWNDSSTDTSSRRAFKSLFKEGRIQIVGSPWVQPDFANSDFTSIFENFEVGRDFIEQTLGESKDFGQNFGWIEDAMGFSGSTPELLALLGIDSFYVSSLP